MWSETESNLSNPWNTDRAYRESFKPPTPSKSTITSSKKKKNGSRNSSNRKSASSKKRTKDAFLTIEEAMSDISFTSDTSPQKEAEDDQLLRRNIQVLEKKMKLYKDLLRQSEKRKERGKRKVVLTLDKLHDLLRRAKEEGYAKGLKDASISSSSTPKKSLSNIGNGDGDLYDDAFSLSVVTDRRTSVLLPRMTREKL